MYFVKTFSKDKSFNKITGRKNTRTNLIVYLFQIGCNFQQIQKNYSGLLNENSYERASRIRTLKNKSGSKEISEMLGNS